MSTPTRTGAPTPTATVLFLFPKLRMTKHDVVIANRDRQIADRRFAGALPINPDFRPRQGVDRDRAHRELQRDGRRLAGGDLHAADLAETEGRVDELQLVSTGRQQNARHVSRTDEGAVLPDLKRHAARDGEPSRGIGRRAVFIEIINDATVALLNAHRAIDRITLRAANGRRDARRLSPPPRSMAKCLRVHRQQRRGRRRGSVAICNPPVPAAARGAAGRHQLDMHRGVAAAGHIQVLTAKLGPRRRHQCRWLPGANASVNGVMPRAAPSIVTGDPLGSDVTVTDPVFGAVTASAPVSIQKRHQSTLDQDHDRQQCKGDVTPAERLRRSRRRSDSVRWPAQACARQARRGSGASIATRFVSRAPWGSSDKNNPTASELDSSSTGTMCGCCVGRRCVLPTSGDGGAEESLRTGCPPARHIEDLAGSPAPLCDCVYAGCNCVLSLCFEANERPFEAGPTIAVSYSC